MNGKTAATRRRQNGYRGPLALILTLLVPPLGILVLWRMQIYRLRGRVLLTILGTAVMVLFFRWTMPVSDVVAATPATSATELFTAAPESDVLTALSTLEEIARAQVPESEDSDSTVIQVAQEQQLIAQQALLDTIVYSVYRNAKYYHAGEDCEGQHNGRRLTIRDALQEGLAPCPDCDPPVYNAVSYESPAIEPNNLDDAEEVEFGAETVESNTFPEVNNG